MLNRFVERINPDKVILEVMTKMVTRTFHHLLDTPSLDWAYELRDYYSQKELLDHPERFYRHPETRLPLKQKRRGKLQDGEKRIIIGKSGFVPHRLVLRDEWARHTANARLRARWWRHHSRPRKMVCIFHGWGCGWANIDEHLLFASQIYDAGFDVVLPVLPFHGRRSVRPLTSAPPFPSPRLDVTAEGFAQTLWDFRRLRNYLQEYERVESMAVMGWSLGGLISALLATHEENLSAAVCLNPAISVAELFWGHGEGRLHRSNVEDAGFTFEDLHQAWRLCDPLSFPVNLPPERLLVIAGQYDGICTPDQARKISEHWGGAAIHWNRGGHMLLRNRAKTGRRLVEFFNALRRS